MTLSISFSIKAYLILIEEIVLDSRENEGGAVQDWRMARQVETKDGTLPFPPSHHDSEVFLLCHLARVLCDEFPVLKTVSPIGTGLLYLGGEVPSRRPQARGASATTKF